MATKKGNNEAVLEPPAGGEMIEVAVTSIDRSPYQPRLAFPEGEIKDLATSIKQHGLLVRPIVRKKGKRYELVCGERRLRASKIAGLKKIPVECRKLTDDQAAEVAVVENLQRANLNAIEEANALKLLWKGTGKNGKIKRTQTEAAVIAGISQGQFSNRVRLLDLPEAVQQWIISHEIPPTHARELLAIKDHPKIIALVMKDVDKDIKQHGEIEGVGSFQWTIRNCVVNSGRRIEGQSYEARLGEHIPHFKPTDQQREQLGILEVECRQVGKTIDVATNTKLWDKLQAEFGKQYLAEHSTKGKKKPKAAGNGKLNGKTKPQRKLTAAQKKEQAAEEARKAREQAKIVDKWLWTFQVNWQRLLISRWIREEADEYGLLRLGLLLDTEWMGGYQWSRGDRLATVLRDRGFKGCRNFLAPIHKLEDDIVLEVASRFLARVFWDDGPNEHIVPPDDVVALAKIFEINLDAAWLEDQAGDLTESLWQRLNTAHLVSQAEEWKLDVPKGAKHGDLVKILLATRPKPGDIECGPDMPKILAKVRRPK